MSEWQKIETAPKDGTRILVFSHCDYESGYNLNQAVFKNGWWVEQYCNEYVFPTHWMPLPNPPKEER
jgi:hypothetical protein